MLRVNAINRQELLKCLTFNPKSLVFKTVSVPTAILGKVNMQTTDSMDESIHRIGENSRKILKIY